MKNCFFDTEFTGLRKKTTLISIGIKMDSGERFYAELTDYDESQIDTWIKNNVLHNLIMKKPDTNDYHFIRSNKKEVRKALLSFLSKFEDTIQFVSDVSHYDFVLVQDLLIGDEDKTVFDIPKYISPYCYDINQDIARHLNISVMEAFDVNREEFAEIDKEKAVKHNALWDAEVIERIYKKCNIETKN